MIRIVKRGLVFAILISGLACGPKYQVKWEPYTPEGMAEARKSGRPVLAYFYAAWCPPCYKLKEKTFSDLRVIEALELFRRIKVDMSYRESKRVRAVSAEFGIDGLPTILFMDANGNPVETFRFRGFIPAEEFLQNVERFKKEFLT